jgi:hypothetical protein
MFKAMQQAEDAANKAVRPFQQDIVWGSYWVAVYQELDLVVFGYAPTLEELERSERDAGAGDGEWGYTRATMLDSYARGYRFGKCYSVVVPSGEWGSTHISQMLPITKAQFEFARDNGWSIS